MCKTSIAAQFIKAFPMQPHRSRARDLLGCAGLGRCLWEKAERVAFVLATIVLGTQLAHGAEPAPGIRIDSEAARRTIDAVTNPKLTRAQALLVADLSGNQALIRQAIDFGIPASRETFADALIATAQGSGAWTIFNFKEVRANAETSRVALETLAANPNSMVAWITQRIMPFMPAGIPLNGQGYIVAGGPGGGFSLTDGGIYVNIVRAKGDLNVVRLTLAHELITTSSTPQKHGLARSAISTTTKPPMKRFRVVQRAHATPPGSCSAN